MNSMTLELPLELFPLFLPHQVSVEKFESLCFANPELVIEREANGNLTIMSPVSPISGNRENEISIDLGLYARKNGGKAYSSSTGFRLPDSSVRSPDACYVSAEQLAKFTDKELRHFAPIVPEFIVEVLSPSDDLSELEEKVRKSWIANGVQLAWLVDVDNDRLWIYRADRSVELVTPLDREVGGEDVLPGFTFDLKLLS
ncbi:MAG: Uma2 family endonuclease [Lewinella sp.]